MRLALFVDRVHVEARGGNGGAGVVSFRKIRGKPKGKPDGGSGGQGGDVIARAATDVTTLLRYQRRPHLLAAHGSHGEGDLRNGSRGTDCVVEVPPGTVIRDEAGVVLADLVREGDEALLVEGGRGGRGNAAFVSAAHRAPSFCEQGEYGAKVGLVFELKLLADAALVGFPNAGKSTLISRVSAAKPKIADYPFTTLQPHLGVISVDDHEFTLIDVPGLIEGAAEGKGLGHEFLRHVERARVLVILLDPTNLQPESLERQFDVLLAELAAHSPELADRPRLVVINKIEVEPDATLDRDVAVHRISAVTGTGLEALMFEIAGLVGRRQDDATDRESYIRHRPAGESFTIERDGNGWLVSGRVAERAISFADLTLPEAADLAADRLRRLGVDQALKSAGAEQGDEVRIGEIVFEYQDEEP